MTKMIEIDNDKVCRFVELEEYCVNPNDNSNDKYLQFWEIINPPRSPRTSEADNMQKIATWLKESKLCEIDGQAQTFKFTFVGLLQIGKYVIFSYPKYFKAYSQNPDEIEDRGNNRRIKQILKAIKREKDVLAEYEPWWQEKNGEENPFALKIWLIENFLKNGLYNRREQITAKNGNNEILWDKTISQEQEYLNSKKVPFYLNFITRKKESDTQNPVRRLHKIALNEIVEGWTKSHIADIFAPNVNIDTNEKRDQIGNITKISRVLKNELRAEYNTEKRILIRKLISYFELKNTTDEQNLQLFVTTHFNIVWEQICKKLFNDDKDLHSIIKEQRSKWTVNLQGKDPVVVTEVLDEIEETPDQNITQITKEKSGLIPDIVTTYNSDIIILDAKYYAPHWPKNESDPISSVPGVGDITKQHLYQLAYENHAMKNGLNNRKNAFIMPMPIDREKLQDSKVINYRGKVGVGFLQSVTDNSDQGKLSDIQVFELNPETAFDAYLSEGVGSRTNELIEVFEEVEKDQ